MIRQYPGYHLNPSVRSTIERKFLAFTEAVRFYPGNTNGTSVSRLTSHHCTLAYCTLACYFSV